MCVRYTQNFFEGDDTLCYNPECVSVVDKATCSLPFLDGSPKNTVYPVDNARVREVHLFLVAIENFPFHRK